MPWTGSSFAKHNHGLTGPESSHAARIANAVLKRSHDDGMAIAVANRYFQRHDDGGQVDPTSPGIGGLAPSNETANPLERGMVQRYSSLPPEKLQELAVMMGGSPQGQIIRKVLDQKRTLPNVGGAPQAQSPAAAPTQMPGTGYRRGGKVKKRADGGVMSLSEADPVWTRAQGRAETGGAGATGYLHGPTPGRADAILTTAPAGSYVIPADVVSGLGEGNSMAGAGVMDRIIRTGPHGVQAMPSARVSHGPPRAPGLFHQAKGGAMGVPDAKPQPVALSHGEYVVQPEFVAQWGRGDHKAGVEAFDRWVVKMRKLIIAKMKKLPGPVGAKKQ